MLHKSADDSTLRVCGCFRCRFSSFSDILRCMRCCTCSAIASLPTCRGRVCVCVCHSLAHVDELVRVAAV